MDSITSLTYLFFSQISDVDDGARCLGIDFSNLTDSTPVHNAEVEVLEFGLVLLPLAFVGVTIVGGLREDPLEVF